MRQNICTVSSLGRAADEQLVDAVVVRLHLGELLHRLAHRMHLQAELGRLQLQPHVGAAGRDLGGAAAAPRRRGVDSQTKPIALRLCPSKRAIICR